jgi:hypothetical protein
LYLFLFYVTIFSTPLLFQTEPLGKPADDVGMFFIDSLFTNVVQLASAVILEPTIIAQAQVFVLFALPPKIAEKTPEAVLNSPPPIIETYPEALLPLPPPTVEQLLEAVLR